MRIATWNIERLKHKNKKEQLLSEIRNVTADILVLTETDEQLSPEFPYCYKTASLTDCGLNIYNRTENRVSIFTRYKCIKEYPTFDKFTSICVELETEFGNLIVYGTIIGVFGNREKSFKTDLECQIKDIEELSKQGKDICIIGDYNLSFVDDYYFTKYGRDTFLKMCHDNGIDIVTAGKTECIDHIAISEKYISSNDFCVTSIEEWNLDKALSDHKGIVLELQ